MTDVRERNKSSSRVPSMRAHILKRPNRSEGPCAYATPAQSYENTRSLEPTRKLKNTLARFTALGMTIQWGLILLALSTVQPSGPMIQPSHKTPTAQSTPAPAAITPPIQ